jgi:hypothetical protein
LLFIVFIIYIAMFIKNIFFCNITFKVIIINKQ